MLQRGDATIFKFINSQKTSRAFYKTYLEHPFHARLLGDTLNAVLYLVWWRPNYSCARYNPSLSCL